LERRDEWLEACKWLGPKGGVWTRGAKKRKNWSDVTITEEATRGA